MATDNAILGHQLEVGPVIGSGILSYTIPVQAARTEPGQEAAPHAVGAFSQYTSTAHPHTGRLIEGWRWDERTWSEDRFENDALILPNNWDPTTSGIEHSHFQSGIGSGRDLEVESIDFVNSSGINQTGVFHVWAPRLNHGYYFDFEEQHYLFSDDSEIEYVSFSGVNQLTSPTISGFNIVELSHIPKVGVPVVVEQLQWNNTLGKYELAVDVRKKVHFTGLRDDAGARQDTFDLARESILWDLIDNEEPEFIISTSGVNPQVILNGQYVSQVGAGAIPGDLEVAGFADGSANQQFHLGFAPVDSTMGVDVYSYITASGVITQWEAIAFDEVPVGNQVRVDYDLGILEFGDPAISGQLIPGAGSTVAASYFKTFRVQYEPADTDNIVLATEASVNQIYRRQSRGFVYLSTRLEDPTSITLRADLPQIQQDVFGPIFIGNSFAPLVATVTDSLGNKLEDQTVSFFVTSEPAAGGFGASSTTTSSTDFNGESRAFYTPPRGINDLGENITASNWSTIASPTDPILPSGLLEATVLHTERLLIAGELDDIFLYEVHVDDPLQGILDVTLDQEDINVQLEKYYQDFFERHDIWGPTGMQTPGGPITPNTAPGTQSTDAAAWEFQHRLFWSLVSPTIFSSNSGLGRKKLVAKFDTEFLNPHTLSPGAVGPVQPIAVQPTGNGEFDVYFDTSTNSIPIPSGTDTVPSGTLHSYFLVAPTTIRVQASVFNARLNQTILSNEITLKLSIPAYLSGIWILDAINQSEVDEISSNLMSLAANGQRIPLGFRLRSSRVTLAGAVDGVTFLDVNQQYNYDAFDNDYELNNPITHSGVNLGHQMRVFPVV